MERLEEKELAAAIGVGSQRIAAVTVLKTKTRVQVTTPVITAKFY
jgi:hypothetical protein